ncbi:hypothetical protein [Nonomuraea guangzhouensis]|uniref:Uncharacterized protein n=1 Tax=Nonomuraea guangzhouensis TaxID=1291555 RepID=A0ABW4G9K5_9ACTN|nr:hypothetical protein [Nonomuraea guangzhouensis]
MLAATAVPIARVLVMLRELERFRLGLFAFVLAHAESLSSLEKNRLRDHMTTIRYRQVTNMATAASKELDLDPANYSDSVKICDPEPFCPYCIKGAGQKA